MKNIITALIILTFSSACAFSGVHGKNKLYKQYDKPTPREELKVKIVKASLFETMNTCAKFHEQLSGTPYLLNMMAVPGACAILYTNKSCTIYTSADMFIEHEMRHCEGWEY